MEDMTHPHPRPAVVSTAYSSPTGVPFSINIPFAPPQSDSPRDRAASLARLRAATETLQDLINAELTSRMEAEAARARENKGDGDHGKGKPRARKEEEDKAVEQNYGEEIQEGDV